MNLRRALASFCDQVVLTVSPEWGARRIAVRKMWDAAEARFATFEGAENTSARADKWLGSRLSADSALEMDLPTLRQRAREVYRNDSVGGAVDDRVNHVIYTGYRPQAKIKGADGKLNKPLNVQLERHFKRWQKHAGRNGKQSLTDVLRLAERCHAVDGESFVVMSDLGRTDKPVPLALEVVDCDRVETPPQHMGNPRVRMGIEYDADGQIVAYWIRRTHPDDTLEVNFEYDRVDAWRVCHRFEAWFAGQSRGLPWMTRVLNRVKDAKDYDEAAILAAQVEACYAGFVEGFANPLSAARGAGTGTNANGNRTEDIQPGTIKYMAPGEKMHFGTPSRPGGGFTSFQEWNYRRAAAGMNYPYELLVKNWTGTSFAGGRLALTNGRMQFRVGQQQTIEQVLEPIWRRFVAECVILGLVDIDPRAFDAEPEEYCEHCWIAPAWPYALNPGEEINATITKVQGNMQTHADALAEQGLDYDEVMEARQEERADELDRNIVPRAPNGSLPPQPVEETAVEEEPVAATAA